MVATLAMVWLIMGFDLSFHKAQLGQAVNWVGYRVTHWKEGVKAEIEPSFLQDIKDATAELLARSFVGIKKLRSYTGRCTHVSNLLFAWRPFFGPSLGGFFIYFFGSSAHQQAGFEQ